jgi:dTDP-glucose pyrophosphorylase
MIKIDGKPTLEHIIDYLNIFDVKNIFINVHYKYDKIVKHFADKVLFFYESELSGEDGAIKKLVNIYPNILDEYLIVVNGDTLTNLNLDEMYLMGKGRSVMGWNSVYTGVKILSPLYLAGKTKKIYKYFADFWWCDMGTWNGLKKAKKEYAKKLSVLSDLYGKIF